MNKRKPLTLFAKPDEMEAAISYQAMRMTWIIVNVIFIGVAVWFLINGGINPISILAILAVEVIYFVIKSFLSWRMTAGGKDT